MGADTDTPAAARRFTRAAVSGRTGPTALFGTEALKTLTVIAVPLMIVTVLRAAQGQPIDWLLYRLTPFIMLGGLIVTAASLRFRLGGVLVQGDAVALLSMWDVATGRTPVGRERVLRIEREPDRTTATVGLSVYTFSAAAWPELDALTAALESARWQPSMPNGTARADQATRS